MNRLFLAIILVFVMTCVNAQSGGDAPKDYNDESNASKDYNDATDAPGASEDYNEEADAPRESKREQICKIEIKSLNINLVLQHQRPDSKYLHSAKCCHRMHHLLSPGVIYCWVTTKD
jgi:hypothetical protein